MIGILTHHWNRRSRILLLENIEMYISAGLNLHTALDAVIPTFKKKQRASLIYVRKNIEKGQLFSKGMKQYLHFPSTIVGLIEQGERSGTMPQALNLARNIIEREDTLIKTCMGAMTYPLVIGIFAGTLTLCLMRGVMPQIIPLLRSLHATLPRITIIVMYISEHSISYGLYILISLILGIPCVIFFYKKFHSMRLICHTILVRIPLFGNLYMYYNLSLILRSFGSLVLSGAHIIDSYDHAIARVALIPLKNHFNMNRHVLSQGAPLFSIFSKIKHVPSYIAPLISAGETSGTLGSSFVRSADILDRDIEQSLKRITALIEPLLMIGMGCIVGSIALSIVMPIYDVSKALQH